LEGFVFSDVNHGEIHGLSALFSAMFNCSEFESAGYDIIVRSAKFVRVYCQAYDFILTKHHCNQWSPFSVKTIHGDGLCKIS